MEISSTFKVGGMTCILCANKLEYMINKLPGINKVNVSYSTEILNVTYQEELCSEEQLTDTITAAGFFIDDGDKFEVYLKQMKQKIIIGILLILPIMVAMISCWIGDLAVAIDPEYKYKLTLWCVALSYKLYFFHSWKLQVLLTIPIQFILGAQFYKNAWYSIRSKQYGMDLLVVIGTTTTFCYSLYVGLTGGASIHRNLYFESGAMIILFIMIGKYLEALAKKKTSNSIEALMNLQPQVAWVEVEGKIVPKKVQEIEAGTIVYIYPQEIIPIDGYVVEGNTLVDEAMITGESENKEKTVGDCVLAGTLNKQTLFKAKVLKVQEETYLSSIIESALQAQSSKPNIQKLTDLISRYFSLGIITVAGIAFCFWYCYVYHLSKLYLENALLIAASILVVACPCAIGLAIPMAVSTGMGIGIKHGILVKNAQSIQVMKKVDTIVFDKTGTLTNGNCQVEDVFIVNEHSHYNEEEIIGLVTSIERERGMEHPIGKAIMKYAKGKDIVIPHAQTVEEIIGKGLSGTIGHTKIKVGNKKFIDIKNEENLPIQKEGMSLVYVEIDGELEAVCCIRHAIKEGVLSTIKYLKEHHIDVIMMSGDQKKSTESIAKILGIEHVYSEMLPEDKLNIIDGLKQKGKRICMIGDGTNDAPALSKADVSIAMDTGTQAAIKSSDIVIVGGAITQIKTLHQLSNKTMKKVYSNLFLAIIYNTIAIPIAFLGKLSPEIASATMGLSSISVVINSIRLKRFDSRSN